MSNRALFAAGRPRVTRVSSHERLKWRFPEPSPEVSGAACYLRIL